MCTYKQFEFYLAHPLLENLNIDRAVHSEDNNTAETLFSFLFIYDLRIACRVSVSFLEQLANKLA